MPIVVALVSAHGTLGQTPAPPIVAAAFTLDGKFVVTGAESDLVVWDAATSRKSRTIASRLTQVHDVMFLPHQSTLVVAGGTPGESGQIEILSWPDGASMAVHTVHSDLCYRLAWHHERRELICGSADHLAKRVRTDGHIEHEYLGHSRSVTAIVALPDQFVLSGSNDHSLRLWDAGGKLVKTLDNHTGPIHDLKVRPAVGGATTASKAVMVASASSDRTVRLWQPMIGRLVRFSRLATEPTELAWSPDGQQLFAACRDGHLREFDPDTMEVRRDTPALDGWSYCLAVSPDGQQLFVGGERGQGTFLSIGLNRNSK